MIKRIFLYSIVFLVVQTLQAQCNPKEYLPQCKEHLDADKFRFLKEFSIESKNGEMVEHSFVLSDKADYEYYFAGDDWDHHSMLATLYGPDHKEIMTNHPTSKEFLHALKFHPKKMGVYYIRFTFKEGESFCGSAVLGFYVSSLKQ